MALPKCGLYRTGIALSGKDEVVPAGRLISFHNHSEQGPPVVLLPEANDRNHWSFQSRGYLVDGVGAAEFMVALIPLSPQGFYVVRAPVELAGGRILGKRALVQVGYNRAGEVILFPAEAHGNGFVFAATGFRFNSLNVFESLREAGFDPPEVDEPDRLLH